jgi:uncharacterized membrane protein YgdD (TMEM256/DUF423 family)
MDAFAFGALNGALSVGMGAFGAHALKNRFKDYPVADREYYQDVWKTASAYHLAHSLAICIGAFTAVIMEYASFSVLTFTPSHSSSILQVLRVGPHVSEALCCWYHSV